LQEVVVEGEESMLLTVTAKRKEHAPGAEACFLGWLTLGARAMASNFCLFFFGLGEVEGDALDLEAVEDGDHDAVLVEAIFAGGDVPGHDGQIVMERGAGGFGHVGLLGEFVVAKRSSAGQGIA
jgi:hypothetical protein